MVPWSCILRNLRWRMNLSLPISTGRNQRRRRRRKKWMRWTVYQWWKEVNQFWKYSPPVQLTQPLRTRKVCITTLPNHHIPILLWLQWLSSSPLTKCSHFRVFVVTSWISLTTISADFRLGKIQSATTSHWTIVSLKFHANQVIQERAIIGCSIPTHRTCLTTVASCDVKSVINDCMYALRMLPSRMPLYPMLCCLPIGLTSWFLPQLKPLDYLPPTRTSVCQPFLL